MKIQNSSHPDNQSELSVSDITELLLDLQEKHRNVFMQQIDNITFFFRALGRSEYKKILGDDRFSDMEKEELICQICTLWPQEFDFDNCDAGTPTVLAKAILKHSFLDSIEARRNVLDHYRSEMHDLDNQITCIIHEAFPEFDIEEIEEWSIEKTTKYLSRAEWKLHNLRGLQFHDTNSQESYYEQRNTNKNQQVTTEEIGNKSKRETIRGGDKKEKITPEKLAELRAKFPEIDWEADTISTEGIQGMYDSVDTMSPALRPGF